MPPRKKKSKGPIYQIKIELLYAPYPVWRRIVTLGQVNLSTFIYQMIAGMGWYDCHLHLLRIGTKEYQGVEEGGGYTLKDEFDDIEDAEMYLLSDVLKKGDEAYLNYDFGDNWQHRLVVEEVFEEAPEGMRVPSCLDGGGACPPEDCGGVSGLEELVELMDNPKKDPDEYKSYVTWLGGKKFKKDAFKATRMTTRIRAIR